MIELVIFEFLNNQNIGIPVYMEVPENPPKEFYLLQKTGSDMSDRIYKATIVVQSYAGSLYQAAVNNETIKELMIDGLIDDPDIASVRLNSDYEFTDTQEKRYRYQAVFDITHY